MPLHTGDRLGPYEIVAPIGAGGMGEVYRARDPRVGREVAIKVSAEGFSERFEREARAIASLNHPNICTLHDVGPNYLVMELVEGDPPKGPLDLEEALRIARQIAEALEYAHERGVVHRDLKPDNIRINREGNVKVLDFGLAKLGEGSLDPARASPENSPTLTANMTAAGMILGTAAYMAPEQAQGKPVDKRADIWAFGVVLYELFTGERLFRKETVTETLAAVLRDEPDWDAVPVKARRLVRRCLAKDPKRRLRDIGDGMALLEETAEVNVAASRRGWLWPGIAAALALLAVAAMAALLRRSVEPYPVSRWPIALAESAPDSGLSLALSRDGTRLAYAEQWGPSSRIVVRMLDQPEARPIPGTEGGLRPFFSPDGQWLGYVGGTRGALRKVPVSGGTPVTLCASAFFNGASWGDDDRIVFSSGNGLMRVSASGGVCETFTQADQQKGEDHRWPQILPGGRMVLFTTGTGLDFESTGRLVIADLKNGSMRVVLEGAVAGRYIPTGHLAYVRRGVLYAAPFDDKKLSVTGPEARMAEGIAYRPNGGFADYAFSDSGLLVYGAEVRAVKGRLAWLDRTGASQDSAAQPRDYRSIRLSPDGQRAAVDFGFTRESGQSGIWIVDLARGASIRLPGAGFNRFPVWTPDGKRVAFSSQSRGGDSGIYWTATDGSGKPELLLATEEAAYPSSWTPDGKTLLFYMGSPGRIWALAAGGEGPQKPRIVFEASASNEIQPVASPDGGWVAYTSNESGKNQIYARPLMGAGGKVPVSTGTGEQPRWSRDGRQLFYRDAENNQLMSVEMQTGATMRAGKTRALFTMGALPWDVTPEGTRFLALKPAETTAGAAQLHLVVNWFDELRRKAPLPR